MSRTGIAIAALLLGVAVSAGAQQVDARWAPFAGCWQLVDGGADVCIAPAAPGAVTLSTRVEGEPVLEQTIVADGAPHALNEAGCTGTQRAEWSRDGRKLFIRADLACADQPSRTVTGIALMTGDRSWLDVQAIEIAGRTNVRVRRYRRAAGDGARAAASVAPYVGGATFTVDDVQEASAKIAPAALEAVLTETGGRFALNARELIALDDAGVEDSVIDLMIAMSYPERFQVERRADASVDMYPPALADASWSGYWGLGYPYFSSYPGYYGNYRYYYSPFGYAYSGLFGPSSYYYPRSVVVIGGGIDLPATPSEEGDGRVVDGVGYTRVRTREAAAADTSSVRGRTSSSGGTITPSGATQSRGGDSSSSGGSSSSSGDAGGGGRTAQPR